jgi:hypothetical protein
VSAIPDAQPVIIAIWAKQHKRTFVVNCPPQVRTFTILNHLNHENLFFSHRSLQFGRSAG